MAVNIQVKYFNSIWLKKVCPVVLFGAGEDLWKGDLEQKDYVLGIGQWPGLPWTPTYITSPTYPGPDAGTTCRLPSFSLV